jgi:hypothetical protein
MVAGRKQRVFIFGAGVSVFAGFPLAGTLWPFLLDHVEVGFGRMEWIDAYLSSQPDQEEAAREAADLEWLLTRGQTNALSLGNRVCRLDPGKKINWPSLRRFFEPYKHLMANRRSSKINLSGYYRAKLERRSSETAKWFFRSVEDTTSAIADAFIYHHSCILFGGHHFRNSGDYAPENYFHEQEWRTCPCFRRFNLQKHRSVAKSLARRILPNDTIITFNYDALIESFLWKAGKWTPSTGYGFNVEFHPVRIKELQGKRSKVLANSPVILLKAHGSINWLRNHEDGSVGLKYLRLLFDLPTYSSYLPDQERSWRVADQDDLASQGPDWPHTDQLILSPTYQKDYESDETLSLVWRKIGESLRDASEITIVGYSLPSGDKDARRRIKTALLDNTKCKQITVVSPTDTNWPFFLQDCNQNFRTIRNTFEQWIQSG